MLCEPYTHISQTKFSGRPLFSEVAHTSGSGFQASVAKKTGFERSFTIGQSPYTRQTAHVWSMLCLEAEPQPCLAWAV